MREAKSRFQTDSGIELEPFYRPDTNPPEIGTPGEFPYTRGVQPTMYRGRLWINALARSAVVSPKLGSILLDFARFQPALLRFLTRKIVR